MLNHSCIHRKNDCAQTLWDGRPKIAPKSHKTTKTSKNHNTKNKGLRLPNLHKVLHLKINISKFFLDVTL